MTNQAQNESGKPEQPPLSPRQIDEHIVEIVSDSGEGAQKAGQSFGSISAKMGNGVWTVEIIPAEVQPPPREKAGASGIRIRFGTDEITNMGDEADLVVAFNEQVLYGRIDRGAFKKGTILLLENKWADDESEEIRNQYAAALKDFQEFGYDIHEIPMEQECLRIVTDAHRGKNMWVLGMLCAIYSRDLNKAQDQVRHTFRRKSERVVQNNIDLLDAGYKWAVENLSFRFDVPANELQKELVVMNGNEAVGMGAMAAGIEVCSMYPITPATSATHYLAEAFDRSGGVIHQAEDEIAAIGFAIGASYAGQTPITITSGPGMSLKSEFLGLAVMCEVPLVIVNVQRGGPSTGLPTKVEQGDLMQAVFGQHGDNPKVVIAASTIEECFHFVIMARKIAEAYRMPVILLTDANLATGVSPFPRPKFQAEWFPAPINQSPWKKGIAPYEWDEKTGLSERPIPGQPGGQYVLTGLAHDKFSAVAYDPESNQKGCDMRSLKISTFQKTLKKPQVYGEESGELLLVGWGSTRGAIEEAVRKARKLGAKVSSVHLRYLSPFEPGLKEIFSRFKKVRTVEINYGDDISVPGICEDSRRYSQLAFCLRAKTLIDIDYFSNVYGQPMNPGLILDMIKKELLSGNPETEGEKNVRA
jgi:2-oxoglutarate ferredoxin oxidoreductase subunit alpha